MTYDYTASALGLGGVLKHPNGTTTVIPSLASVHLAPTGGGGSSEISNYAKDGVSFSKACSTVLGFDSGYRTFTSRSDVYITHLNLFGRVKVDFLQTSITSTREVIDDGGMSEASNPDNARFSMQSMIRGLVIDGIEVIPEFDLDLSACTTYEQFTQRIGGASVGMYAQQFGVEATELRNVLTAKVQPIRASCIKALQHVPTDKFGPRKGFKLPVKHFGNVHFGELVVKPGRRRVNLLRIEFDSGLTFMENEFMAAAELEQPTNPAAGSMTVLSQDSNGSPSWP